MLNEAVSVAAAIEHGCRVCMGISTIDSCCEYRTYYPYFKELHARGVRLVIEATVIRTCRRRMAGHGGVNICVRPLLVAWEALARWGWGSRGGRKKKTQGPPWPTGAVGGATASRGQ